MARYKNRKAKRGTNYIRKAINSAIHSIDTKYLLRVPIEIQRIDQMKRFLISFVHPMFQSVSHSQPGNSRALRATGSNSLWFRWVLFIFFSEAGSILPASRRMIGREARITAT